jgi:hypothetical protein
MIVQMPRNAHSLLHWINAALRTATSNDRVQSATGWSKADCPFITGILWRSREIGYIAHLDQTNRLNHGNKVESTGKSDKMRDLQYLQPQKNDTPQV